MPSRFGTGLLEGVIGGWTKQSEQQDQIKRQEKQQQIENNLRIINAQDLPDDVKQNAAQQLQDLMQGKKPGGKGGGQLSPVLQNLLKMIGKSHGAGGGQSQGGMTENLPNGQAAPGTAGSSPGAGFPGSSQPAGGSPPSLPQGANGRPTLQGSGSAATDASPQTATPAGGTTETQPKQSTLDAQIDAAQRAIAGTQNPITKQRLVDRLGQLTDLKIKQEGEEAKEERTETGKETLEKIKAQHSTELQKLKDDSAKAIAEARAESAKAAADAKVKAEKELEDLKEKHREELRHVIASTRASGGGESKAQTRRGQQIEDKKNAELRKAEEDFARAKAKADQLPPGQAKGAALRDAMDALNTAKAQAQSEYLNAVKQNAKSVSYIDGGKTYTIPRDKEKEFLKDHPQAQAA
jgi:hypothetical protein